MKEEVKDSKTTPLMHVYRIASRVPALVTAAAQVPAYQNNDLEGR